MTYSQIMGCDFILFFGFPFTLCFIFFAGIDWGEEGKEPCFKRLLRLEPQGKALQISLEAIASVKIIEA